MVPSRKIQNNIFPNNKQWQAFMMLTASRNIRNMLQSTMKPKKPHSGPVSKTFCPSKQEFCQNIFTMLSLYHVLAPCNISQKFNASICYGTLKFQLRPLSIRNSNKKFFPKTQLASLKLLYWYTFMQNISKVSFINFS